MPKATLTYNLPEEEYEFELACKALHLQVVIDEFDNYLRGRLKYETLTDEQDKTLEEVRSKFWELKND